MNGPLRSSINTRPTFQYSQPEAYRFSHDSVFLSQQVWELTRDRMAEGFTLLDLCAGCGIVGLDFLFHGRDSVHPSRCDFVEVQAEYKPHFEENARRLGSRIPLHFHNQCYSELLSAEGGQFDLVLCNPPFFRVGQGRLPESDFKRRCRFFIDSDFSTLLKAIAHVLKDSGEAYVLLRESTDHGEDVFGEAERVLMGHATIATVGDVRGTALARIRRI